MKRLHMLNALQKHWITFMIGMFLHCLQAQWILPYFHPVLDAFSDAFVNLVPSLRLVWKPLYAKFLEYSGMHFYK